MALTVYKTKRDFRRTPEPKPARKTSKDAPLFVIQKHAASRLHYDFRLEMGGALKSWAVPKGVPFKKGEKRLAMQVEDHPLDYARFEGTIPEGEYGGGTVMVWDIGRWELLGGDPEAALEEGKLHFKLDGKKLRGEWALVRFKRGGENAWLLLKSGESMRPVSKKRDDESALTGCSMNEIADDKAAVWKTGAGRGTEKTRAKKTRSKEFRKRIATLAKEQRARAAEASADLIARLRKLKSARPAFVSPMKANLVDAPPRGSEWIFELKFDGFRALAVIDRGKSKLLSRNRKSLTKKFPEIAAAVKRVPVKRAVLDGEICALDAEGRPSFQLLQRHEHGEERPPVCYYVFDLLNLDGRDTRALPLADRKALIEPLAAAAGEPVWFSANIEGDPKKLLAEVERRGLEGLIGKRRDSKYEAGRRSGAWIKIKAGREQEFVIAGYTQPQGTRKYFGAILIGFHENGRLVFAGKVGTGFDAKDLGALHARFKKLEQKQCPFADLPAKKGGKWLAGITPAQMKRITWLKPKLVCHVRFAEWTADGKLRAPVYLGLREDKDPREVVRETV
jgi:bifunctional non-homologous end joining protein LigD